MTARLRVAGRTVIGTAGQGLWLAATAQEPRRRLTPTDQVCGNHIMAMAEYRGRAWFGSFDGGLCTTRDGRTFERVAVPFRLINELEATPHGLFVASSDGLFRTRDGVAFERVLSVTERGVNGLAYDGRSLWVTTPGALFRVKLGRGPRNWNWWMPAGSRSLQAVAVDARGRVWIATEDRGVVVKVGRRFAALDRAAGLPTSWMLDVAVGADGVAYAASLRDGAFALEGPGRGARPLSGVPGQWGLDVHEDPAGLWVGTQSGAALLGRDGAVAEVTGLPHPNVHGFLRAGDRLYVATEGGLLVGQAPLASR